MTTSENPEIPAKETKVNDKEFNFRAQEAKYERILAQERAERERISRELEETRQSKSKADDDDDSEPYVDHKKLEKKLARFGEQNQKQTQSEIQRAVQVAIQEERKQNWIKENPDFYKTLQNNAEKLYQKDPELAETILEMPESFERQKLVYKNIKALGLDQPEQKQSSIQDKIDSNRRNVFYQPSGIPNAPYAQTGDFSEAGKKNAYDQVQKLKANLRLG